MQTHTADLGVKAPKQSSFQESALSGPQVASTSTMDAGVSMGRPSPRRPGPRAGLHAVGGGHSVVGLT